MRVVVLLLVALGVVGCAKKVVNPTKGRVRLGRAPPPDERVHVVQRGETLMSIAARYSTSVGRLVELNGLSDPNRLAIGQQLYVAEGSVLEGSYIGDRRPVDEPFTEASIGLGPYYRDPDRPPPIPSSSGGPLNPVNPTADEPLDCGAHGNAPGGWVASSRGFAWPVNGTILTRFGKFEGRTHEGLAIGAPRGTAVWASSAGQVVMASQAAGYGKLVVVEHDSGYLTLYGGLERNCVGRGARVDRGTLLGLVGTSGGVASPRLYFELRRGESRLNPRGFLP